MGPQPAHLRSVRLCNVGINRTQRAPLICYNSFSHHTDMETFLTPDEILQLVTTGVCTLSDDLIIRMTPKVDPNSYNYEDEDWYNDPNSVMSRWHY